MSDKIWTLMFEVPVVALFILHTWLWRDYLEKRNGTLERAMERMAKALERLRDDLNASSLNR